jgi:hypothetical protein
MLIYQNSQPGGGVWASSSDNFGYPYFLVSLSLNILLTLMIIARLVVHNRGIRSAIGALTGTNRLYKAIITMLIESCALYTLTFLLVIGTWGTRDYFAYISFPILAQTQVGALFHGF